MVVVSACGELACPESVEGVESVVVLVDEVEGAGVSACPVRSLCVSNGVEVVVESVVVVSVVEVEDDVALGSTTWTVRVAVPVLPAASVALYVMVWSPATEVSIVIAEMSTSAPPSTDAVMPIFGEPASKTVAPRSE